MNRTTVSLFAIAVGIGAFALACSEKKEVAAEKQEVEKEYVVLGELVNLQDSLPRVRYFEDSQVTLNDRCAVRKVKLNPKMPAVYVNGQPIGFC